MDAFGLMIANPIEFYSCFISYSHRDKDFARAIYDSLQGRGIRCWMDERALLPGDDIYDKVNEGIRLWDKILLCCSEDSLTSWWVEDEIDKALESGAKTAQNMLDHNLILGAALFLNGQARIVGDIARRQSTDVIPT